MGFLPLYKLRGKKPKLIFPIQFKHKYKYLKGDFSSTFFFGRKKNEQNLIALHKNPGNYAQRLCWSFAEKRVCWLSMCINYNQIGIVRSYSIIKDKYTS